MPDVPPPSSPPDPSRPPVPWGWASWSQTTSGPGRAPRWRGAGVAIAGGLVLTLALSVVGVVEASRLAPPGSRPDPRDPRPVASVGRATTNVTGFAALDDPATAANDCTGVGSNADLDYGTPVTLTDDAGIELGSGELQTSSRIGSRCTYAFIIADVPSDEPVYVVQIADRPPVSMSHDALRSQAWGFIITL